MPSLNCGVSAWLSIWRISYRRTAFTKIVWLSLNGGATSAPIPPAAAEFTGNRGPHLWPKPIGEQQRINLFCRGGFRTDAVLGDLKDIEPYWGSKANSWDSLKKKFQGHLALQEDDQFVSLVNPAGRRKLPPPQFVHMMRSNRPLAWACQVADSPPAALLGGFLL